jgi:hypothetical protein
LIIKDSNFLDINTIKNIEEIVNENNQDLQWIGIESTNNVKDIPALQDKKILIEDGPQMVHSASLHDDVFSFIYDIGSEILNTFAKKNGINVKKILRVKANTVYKKEEANTIHPPHIDMHIPHFVFLYYINDSDGETVIFDQKYSSKELPELTVKDKITPKAGTAIVFNGLNYHSSSAPTINNKRSVININFMGDINL